MSNQPNQCSFQIPSGSNHNLTYNCQLAPIGFANPSIFPNLWLCYGHLLDINTVIKTIHGPAIYSTIDYIKIKQYGLKFSEFCELCGSPQSTHALKITNATLITSYCQYHFNHATKNSNITDDFFLVQREMENYINVSPDLSDYTVNKQAKFPSDLRFIAKNEHVPWAVFVNGKLVKNCEEANIKTGIAFGENGIIRGRVEIFRLQKVKHLKVSKIDA